MLLLLLLTAVGELLGLHSRRRPIRMGDGPFSRLTLAATVARRLATVSVISH